jgi:hypothetical protein
MKEKEYKTEDGWEIHGKIGRIGPLDGSDCFQPLMELDCKVCGRRFWLGDHVTLLDRTDIKEAYELGGLMAGREAAVPISVVHWDCRTDKEPPL